MSDQNQGEGALSRRARRRSRENDADESRDEGAEPKPVQADAAPAPKAREVLDRNQRVREEAMRRRAQARKIKGRTGGEGGLQGAEVVDDALARSTHATVGFLRRHFNVLQWVIVGGIGLAIGTHIYNYHREGKVQEASGGVFHTIQISRARVGDVGVRGPDQLSGLRDTQKAFATDADRQKALSEAFRKLEKDTTLKGSAVLAEMGLAGVAFDGGKYDEASQRYLSVKASKLSESSPELKGQALLGAAFSREAAGDLEGALKPLRELENMAFPPLTPMAQYQQARMLHAAGQSEKAKALLEKASKKLEDSRKPLEPPTELATAVRSLLSLIDPTAVKAAEPSGLTPEQIQRMLSEMSQRGGNQAPAEPVDSPAPAQPPPPTAPPAE